LLAADAFTADDYAMLYLMPCVFIRFAMLPRRDAARRCADAIRCHADADMLLRYALPLMPLLPRYAALIMMIVRC